MKLVPDRLERPFDMEQPSRGSRCFWSQSSDVNAEKFENTVVVEELREEIRPSKEHELMRFS